MTPEQRKAAAQARTLAREEAERAASKVALVRRQAKIRKATKRDSALPKGMKP